MPKSYPIDFRRDAVRVARNSEQGVMFEQIAADFGDDPITLLTGLKRVNIEGGAKPGVTNLQSADLREANNHIRLLKPEAEVSRRASVYLSQGSLPGEGSTRS